MELIVIFDLQQNFSLALATELNRRRARAPAVVGRVRAELSGWRKKNARREKNMLLWKFGTKNHPSESNEDGAQYHQPIGDKSSN